ncbi:dienelactone hydrolase family protein [Roseomonas sp. OT10]|uniref:dienelactone hydrolase family protein n=1 Tax=Roseomonas cutis TaxID=2897332 RepID=UPI001E41583C|nr:dienelactone hydrolase family protein [Roseomonas sp. OT10]UFN50764.1 dienelactone hydrolase family protein [Roseomonas sp. OT10]
MSRTAALLALLALLVSDPARAAEVVRFPGPGGVALRAVLVLPPGGRPGAPVVALHGCGGLGGPGADPRLPAREADWAARLAALGHPVLFPDSFGSRGLAEVCHGGERGITPETLRREDALAAARWASAQPWAAPGGAFLLGWSHGASTALTAANAPVEPGLIRGAVALYPGCVRPGRAAPAFAPVAPVLMLLGEADDWTPAAPCRRLAARATGAPVEVVAYPDAGHGFDQPRGMPRTLAGLAITPDGSGRATVGQDPAARADALQRVPAFLSRSGSPLHGGVAPQN